MKAALALAALAAGLSAAGPAAAQITARAPYLYRVPGPKPVAEFFLADGLSAEYLATASGAQPLAIGGRSFEGSRKALPPALVLNLHFPQAGLLRPFAGAGLSYSVLHEQATRIGPLEPGRGFGTVVQAGAALARPGAGDLRISLSYARVVSDLSLNGIQAGAATMDPLTLSVSYSTRF